MSSQPAFTPVPLRVRHDGWMPERQTAFIAALKETRCVAAAWDATLAGLPLDRAFAGRAVDGVVTPITYRGRQVGERRRYDDRLAQYILSIRAPDRFDAARAQHPPAAPDWVDALATLEAALADLDPCDQDLLQVT